MLAYFGTAAQQNYYEHNDRTEQVTAFPATDTSSVFLLWLLAFCFYQQVVRLVLGLEVDFWRGVCRFYEVKKRHSLCSGRLARYLKCSRRCEAKRNHCLSSTSSDRCVVGECLAKLAKVHMPPPLPLRKRKSRKPQQDSREEKVVVSTTEEIDVVEPESTTTAATVAPLLIPDLSIFVEVPAAPVTPLIDLARMQNWDLVLKQATRRGAKYHDMDGLYPLHWAVSGGPPQQVVEALLNVYPSGAHKLDKEGSTPLHFATHYAASPGVVELLLKAYPKAVRLQDLYGRSPLYHAVDKCLAMEALKLLVQADPSMATVPCLPKEHRDLPLTRTTATMTPLYIAWARVVRERKIGKGKKQCKPLEKAHLLLEAAFFHLKNVSPSIPRDYYFVSGAIALDLYLPDDVVPMAVEQFPKELTHADEDGRLALSQVAATSQYSQERSDALIALLLKAYAEAASSRDREGRSPLQLALLAGKTWSSGISRLFRAYPEAIGWIDQFHGLPAFAAAASLEAQEAAAMSSRLVGEAPSISAVAWKDPFNLLTPKQRQLLEKARKRLLGTRGSSYLSSDSDDEDDVEEISTIEAERLTTILNLLRSEPSALNTLNTAAA
ncbi:hypothetical protein ACA910_009224 [Epithemia clementina (nom. ined.)]